MNEITAIEIAKSKMRELNVEDYVFRFRHLRLDSLEVREISAENELFIMLERMPFFIIKSKAGIFDLRDTALREIQHVHTGKITITNTIAQSMIMMFLHVIPQQKNKGYE